MRARMYWSSGSIAKTRRSSFGRSEVVKVAEQEAEGVAQLAVVVADALHEVFAGGYVFTEVDGGYPETDDLAA